jgi:hypothetical protein
MRYLSILLVSVLGLVLASCAGNPKLDRAIQDNLPRICSSASQLHASFVIIASTGNVKADLVRKEAAAWAAVDTICRNPSQVNSSTALIRVAEAYAAMIAAMRSL